MNNHENLDALKVEFHREMQRLCTITKELEIRGTVFCSKIRQKGGFLAALDWLSTGNPWTESQLEGVTEFLSRGGKLKDTVEAVVLEPRFEQLYEKDIRDRAQARLEYFKQS